MEIIKLTATEIKQKIKNNELTCEEVVNAFIDQINKFSNHNAVLEVFSDAVEQAKEMDKKIAAGFEGKLAGVPILIKDNILYKGQKACCGSNFLNNYIAQYNSTAVQKALDAGAVIIGRTNMDEFGMGSSTENSAFGVTHNPIDFNRVAGGSSGGSACAVALNMCPIALGTDTGGSSRQPASYCGVVGLKPSYGRISRYGIVAYGSSLDQVGIMTNSVEDNALMLEVLAGEDIHDETTQKTAVPEYSKNLAMNAPIKVGVVKEILETINGMECGNNLNNFIAELKNNNIEVVEVSVKDYNLVLPAYYIIATAEATSNLARFDGVKYTSRSEDAKNLQEIYKQSRSEGFGKEVQRRIMLGNYVLSSGYYDAYYKKSKVVQNALIEQFNNAFNSCDIILMPTTIGEAYEIGSKPANPVETYKEDIFTVTANVIGATCLSYPYGKGKNNLPLGVQFMAPKGNEQVVFKLAKFIEGLGV